MNNKRATHQKLLTRARQECGVVEIPGKRSNQTIIKYHKYTSLKASRDEVSWCSAFVNFIMTDCKHKGTNSAVAKSWLRWGKGTKKPVPGCIVVFWRGNKTGWKGHVGFFIEETKTGIFVLGGNQNNKVCIKRYAKKQLLGYRVLL